MKQSQESVWGLSFGRGRNKGKCETFIKNRLGVVVRWCAKGRKCETVPGISMGVTTWPWTKERETVSQKRVGG